MERNIDTSISDAVLGQIEGASAVIERFGRWPSFHDGEVAAMTLDRGNLVSVFETKDWKNAVEPQIAVSFYVLDEGTSPNNPMHTPSLVTLLFRDVREFKADGFNHQNPIMGLSIKAVSARDAGASRLAVQWGGTALSHDVSFTCGKIKVLRVEPWVGDPRNNAIK